MAKKTAAAIKKKSTRQKPFQIWEVGQAYLIRTVTMHITGRLIHVGSQELVLEDSAWVADSGRFGAALASGSLAEIEPFIDRVIIGRGAIVDATIWRHALPREAK